MSSPMLAEFPTLAEHLAYAALLEEPAAPIVAVFAGAAPDDDVRRLLPDGSVVVAVASDGIRTSDGARFPATPDGLAAVVRGSQGDVLLATESDLLAKVTVSALATALASDSVCTSVSAVPGVRAAAPGLPPPAVDAPVAGLVLVRHADLLLAIDEAGLVEPQRDRSRDERPESLVARVLSFLDRPGFVHRVHGAAADEVDERVPIRATTRADSRPQILIDGSFLAHPPAGTQVQALALVRALARCGADVALLRPTVIHPSMTAALDAAPESIPMVDRASTGRPDIFHRMSQVLSLHELADRLVIGERFVLTHQDMIWNRTRAYHGGDARQDYLRTTEAAFALADQVGFFSLHAARDAASDGGLELDRATVVPLGVDHLVGRSASGGRADPLGGRPYLLMMGSAYRHKNRLFALRLVRSLVERGWAGGLVLVGGESRTGSSLPAEQALMDMHPVLGDRVRSLGYVRDDDHLALYRDAELVLFPSLYEGFGFIPFEAAALGTASVYTLRSSMGELLPPDGALPTMDATGAALFVLRLLEEPGLRARIVEAIQARAATLTWDRTAAGYLEVYERALARPQRPAMPVLRAARELADRAAPTASEALLLDVYRRRRGTRRVVDAAYGAGSAARRTLRSLRRP